MGDGPRWGIFGGSLRLSPALSKTAKNTRLLTLNPNCHVVVSLPILTYSAVNNASVFDRPVRWRHGGETSNHRRRLRAVEVALLGSSRVVSAAVIRRLVHFHR